MNLISDLCAYVVMGLDSPYKCHTHMIQAAAEGGYEN